MSRDNVQKRKESPYRNIAPGSDPIKKHHVTLNENQAFICDTRQLQYRFSTLIFKKKSNFLVSSFLCRSTITYNATALSDRLTCTDSVDFGKCQDRFENSIGPKLIPITWMYYWKFWKKDDNKVSEWYKILQCDEQISASSCDWEISGSLQPKTSTESKICLQCWYQECPKAWTNKSNWLTNWLTKWTEQIETFMWLWCSTIWTSQRVLKLQSKYLQGKKRTKNFNNLSMWIKSCRVLLFTWCNEFCLW